MAVLETLTVLGSLLQLGLLLGGQAEESAEKQRQARENKRLSELAAADAVARGAREAGYARMAGTQMVGEQKVAAAVSGVDPTVGTPAAVSASTAGLAALEAATIENNAAREAWGFKQQGAQFQRAGERERALLPYRQASTILGASGRFADRYSRQQYGGRG